MQEDRLEYIDLAEMFENRLDRARFIKPKIRMMKATCREMDNN